MFDMPTNLHRELQQIYNFVVMTNGINEKYKYNPKPFFNEKELIQGIKSQDKNIVSQAITLIESTHQKHRSLANSILSKLENPATPSIRIGITGSPGVGKSSFIEELGLLLCNKGIKVAVLTIDPSSEKSGGSILGDKTRMETLSANKNVFIRPSPASNFQGGVGKNTRESIFLCESAGYEIILIETVGVGQNEINVAEMVDFFLLLKISGSGDELQGIKRGIRYFRI